MIPNLQPDTTYAVHLRAASPSGGKDWVGSVTTKDEIHTYWGRTGQIIQHAARPGDLSALHRLINQKQNGKDRYTLVEIFTQKDGWQSQRVQPAASAEPTVDAAAVNWVEAPETSIKWDF